MQRADELNQPRKDALHPLLRGRIGDGQSQRADFVHKQYAVAFVARRQTRRRVQRQATELPDSAERASFHCARTDAGAAPRSARSATLDCRRHSPEQMTDKLDKSSRLFHAENSRQLFRAAEVELRLVAGFSAHELFAQRRLRGDDENFFLIMGDFRAASARAEEVE